VELLQPLAIGHIALAAAHIVHVAGVDQYHLEAARLEDLIDRNPIDPGRFHRHGLDLALRQPVGQAVKVSGEGAELTHWLGSALGRHRHEVALLSAVDTGRVGLDAFEQRA